MEFLPVLYSGGQSLPSTLLGLMPEACLTDKREINRNKKTIFMYNMYTQVGELSDK